MCLSSVNSLAAAKGGGKEMVGGRGGEGDEAAKGDVWLVLSGCGSDRLRRVYKHAVSPGIDGVSV